MKFLPVVSVIFVFHLGIIGMLLIQPGCQSKPKPAPSPDVTQVKPAQSIPNQRPTSPAGSNQTLDPAFNSGFTGTTSSSSSAGGLSSPSRPSRSVANYSSPDVLEPVLQPVTQTLPMAGTDTYTVKSGDTLSKIARNQGVSLNDLLRANDLSRTDTIRVGDVLVVPSSSSDTGETVSSSSNVPTGPGVDYTVKSGDSLSRLAKKFGVPVGAIRSSNGLRSDTIYVGQTLVIPTSSDSPPAVTSATTSQPRRSSTSATTPVSSSGATYTVRAGDSPIKIANKFNVEVKDLMAVNGISDPRKLYVGKVLEIPGQAGTATRSTTTKPEARATMAKPTPPKSNQTSGGQVVIPQSSSPQPLSQEESDGLEALEALESLESDNLPFVEVEEVDGSNPGN